MQRKVDALLLVSLLAAALSTYVYVVPRLIGYGVAVGAYLAFASYHIAAGRTVLDGDRFVLIMLLIIFVLYVIHLSESALTGSAKFSAISRVAVFVPVLIINVFIVPKTVTPTFFVRLIARLGAFLVVVGVFITAVGPISIGPITFTPWHGAPRYPLLGPVPMLNSIMGNPNQVGVITALGAAGALDETVRERSPVGSALLLTNCIGLYLTTARGSMATFGIIAFVYLAHRLLNDTAFQTIAVATIFAVGAVAMVFAIAVFGTIPLPINPSGRLELWEGAWHAFRERPILGYGPGDTGVYLRPYVTGHVVGSHTHNSYLRLFLTTGLFGGLAYIGLVVGAVVRQLRQATHGHTVDVLLFCLTLGLAFNQFFEAYSLFGLGITSVLASIVYGFVVNSPPQTELPCPVADSSGAVPGTKSETDSKPSS